MTIIAHEGQPGSGKSYEAVVHGVIPALISKRKVFSNVEGFNAEKIAEVAELDVSLVEELLHHVPDEKVPEIYDHVEDNSLVVIDEIQDFFPSGRQKLSDGMTKFVTRHRHRGIDILIMGQSMADVHNLWRRRIERKLQFTKQDAIGRPDKYLWASFRGRPTAKGDIKYEKITGGSRKYEEKYFGTYSSHDSDDVKTDHLSDDRANVMKTPAIRFGIPIFVLVMIGAILTFRHLMTSGMVAEELQTAEVVAETQAQKDREEYANATVTLSTKRTFKQVASDYINDLRAQGRFRYSGSLHGDLSRLFMIEVIDMETGEVLKTFDRLRLKNLGVEIIEVGPDTLLLRTIDADFMVSNFPIPTDENPPTFQTPNPFNVEG